MHAIFEYIPLVIFFIVSKFVDIYWATASLIVTSALQILYYYVKKEKVPTRNWIFFGLIVVFGGLTIFLHDDAFIKWKVTIINEIFALTLLISYYAFKKNIIKQFQILEKEALIKPEITLYQKDDNRQTVTIQELSLPQINKTKIIGFYETNKYFREQ